MAHPLPTSPAPLVTVVIPTCDRPALLQRAIHSVLRQSDDRWAMIIVDDGAVGGAQALAGPRCDYVKTSGRIGAAAARNIGLQGSRTPWTILLDDDDEMEPDCLAHFLTHHATVVAPAFAIPDWRIIDYDAAGAIERERRRTYDMTPAPSEQNIQQALRAGTCGLAVNAAALAAAGPLDPHLRFVEDTEWLLRLIQAGCEIRYRTGPGFIIHNRRSADQLSSLGNLSARIDECRALQRRYGDLGGRMPPLPGIFDGLIANYQSRIAAAAL